MAELDTNQDELLEAGQPDAKAEKGDKNPPKPVSYTHLTLPTKA